jgi:hypothetical protein
MSTLKFGDRVRCIKNYEGSNLAGLTGTLVCFSGTAFGIEFDEKDVNKRLHPRHLHTLNGNIKKETGWYFGNNSGCLEKIEDQLEFEF